MQAEDLVFDYGSEGNIIEEVGEHGPRHLAAVLLHALVVEAVDLRDPA